ncbi:MAG: TetR/AcrR family transcriptional regulator [Bacteroidota bacterium]
MTDEAIRQKILSKAGEMFFEQGYSKVKMAEIADELGMSKKTLYKYFDGKYDLVRTVLNNLYIGLGISVEEIFSNPNMDYPTKVKKFLKFTVLKLAGIRERFLSDIQDQAPELWKDFDDFKKRASFLRFNKIIDEGIKAGYVSDHVSREMIVAMYAAALQSFMNPDFLKDLPKRISDGIPESTAEKFDMVMNIIFRGILTEKNSVDFSIKGEVGF